MFGIMMCRMQYNIVGLFSFSRVTKYVARCFLLISILLAFLFMSGCTQYHDLSSNWSHRGLQWGRLGQHMIETDGHASFRLPVSSKILVAYEASEFGRHLAEQEKEKPLSVAFNDNDLSTQKQPHDSNKAKAVERDFMHWIASAQAEVFRRYIADAQVVGADLPEAFAEASARGLPLLFYVRPHRRIPVEWLVSNCRMLSDTEALDATASQAETKSGSQIDTNQDCDAKVGKPFQRVNLSFWLYHVQSERVLHAGQVQLQSVFAAQTPREILDLMAPSMLQLVRQWVAVN